MKKPNAQRADILRRLEAARWQRRLTEKAKRTARRRTAQPSPHVRPPQRAKGRIGRQARPQVDLLVPETLDLESTHAETTSFVQEIRGRVRDGATVCLVFEKVKTIRLSALIFLLAQIHKMHLEHGKGCVTGTYPRSRRIERQLAESGFFDLLRVRTPDTVVPSRVNRYIRFKSDQVINASRISELRRELLREDLQMPGLIAKTVFRALSEAMTNVNHHAYATKAFSPESAGMALRGRWWLFATLNVPNNVFVFAFYDTGVGIPKTLPRKYSWEHIRQAIHLLPGFLPDDGQMIEAAMMLGRTRTDLDHRGKGLMDLVKLIDILGAGTMRIYSRHGTYTYTPSSQRQSNRAGFVEGTLIEWRLPIDKVLGQLPEGLYEHEGTED